MARKTLRRQTPKVGAVCLNWARTDLCGGREVTRVPTAKAAGRRNPTGKSLARFIDPSVQPLLQKYSDFPKNQIGSYSPPSCPTEGRLEIVTDAGQDAVDASGAEDESAQLADGKIVWS